MKKISCPKCKKSWDKDFLVDVRIGHSQEGDMPFMISEIKIQDLIFCPICYFSPKKVGSDYNAKQDRVVLQEDNIKIKSIVVMDEFGRYMDMSVDDFKELKVSGFGDFEDDSDDHNSNWGGAGPDCKIERLETAPEKMGGRRMEERIEARIEARIDKHKWKENKEFTAWYKENGYNYKPETIDEADWVIVVRYWAWKAWYARSKNQKE